MIMLNDNDDDDKCGFMGRFAAELFFIRRTYMSWEKNGLRLSFESSSGLVERCCLLSLLLMLHLS